MPPVSNATLWRTSPYVSVGYLYWDTPPTVFAGQITAPSGILFPIADLTYNNVSSGSYTAVRVGATVLFGSTAGASDLGRGRIRLLPTSTNLYINRVSTGTLDGEGDIFDTCYFTVLDEFRPWARVPYIADGATPVTGHGTPALGTLFKDWNLDYSTYGINAYPVVNIGFGSGFAGYVSGGVLTMSFSPASISTFVDGTASTWLWDVRDGTITSGSSTTAAITVTFPPGRRVISLTATDSNGHASIRYLLVVACDDSTITPIKNFVVTSNTLEVDKPREFDVIVYESIARTSLPDQAAVIYWEDEYYNNTHGSLNVSNETLGQTGAESVKFAGWHYQDEDANKEDDKGNLSDVTLKCLDSLGWLNILPGFPFEMDRQASPTSWLYQKGANMDRYFWYILQWHSTALMLTDFYNRSTLGLTSDDYGFSRLGSDGASLFEQINKLAFNAIGYFFTANEQGALYVRPDPLLQITGDRTSTVIVSLTQDDIADIKFTNERFPRSHWDRGAAIVATTVDVNTLTTVPTSFVVAPGLAPGQGVTNTDINQQLVKSTTEHSVRVGNHHARQNSPFNYLEITLIEGGDAGFDPAFAQWVDLSISSAYAAQRGITFTTTRLLLRKAQTKITSDKTGNVKQLVLTCEVETSGIPAAGDPQPQAAYPVSPISIPNIIIPTPPTGPGPNSQSGGSTPTKTGNWAFCGSATQAWVVSNFTGTPLYRDITPTLGSGFTIRHGVLQTGGTAGWILASDGTHSKVFYTSNVFALPTVTWSTGANVLGIYTILRTDGAGNVVIYGGGGGSGFWSLYFDFTQTAGPFSGTANGASGGAMNSTWTSGTGWVGAFDGAFSRGCILTWTPLPAASVPPLNAARITHGRFEYSAPSIGGYNPNPGSSPYPLQIAATLVFNPASPPFYSGTAVVGGGNIFEAYGNGGATHFDVTGLVVAVVTQWDNTTVGGIPSIQNLLLEGTTEDPYGNPGPIRSLTTAYSNNNGNTFAAPVDVDTANITQYGFDLQYNAAVTYAGTKNLTRTASTFGGSFSDDQTLTANPLLIEVPWGKRNSLTLNNTGATPEYLIGLNAPDGSGHSLYWVVGGSPVNITPLIGGKAGIAIGPNSLTTYLGTYAAYLAKFNGTVHLVTTINGGATWVDRGAVNANYARVRRLASSPGQIALAGQSLYYTPNFGATIYNKTKPSSDPLVFFELYG